MECVACMSGQNQPEAMTKTCPNCGCRFSRGNLSEPNWEQKVFCKRQCKNVYHSGLRYKKPGNKLWWAMEHGELEGKLLEVYERRKREARKWWRKKRKQFAA